MFAFESAITKTRDIESRSLSKLCVAIPFSETLADVSARVIYNKSVYCKVTRFWEGKGESREGRASARDNDPFWHILENGSRSGP